MGSYLIPGASSVQEAANYIGPPPLTARWGYAEGGVLFEDTALTDAACAALYVGYVPSGITDAAYILPNPPEVQAGIDRLKAFWTNNPPAVSSAQTATLLHDVVTVLRYLHDRTRPGE
jgi:hypothetical protein